jgi:hypothetical protein
MEDYWMEECLWIDRRCHARLIIMTVAVERLYLSFAYLLFAIQSVFISICSCKSSVACESHFAQRNSSISLPQCL